jgi:hypothetical protein
MATSSHARQRFAAPFTSTRDPRQTGAVHRFRRQAPGTGAFFSGRSGAAETFLRRRPQTWHEKPEGIGGSIDRVEGEGSRERVLDLLGRNTATSTARMPG